MSYQSNREQNNSTQDSDQEYDSPSSYSSTREQKKQSEKEASKKAFKTAAKGVATYFAPGVGGKVVDAVANTKAGQQIINKGGEALNKIPGMGKAAKKLDDKGAIDTADKAIGAIDGGNIGNGAGGGQGASAGTNVDSSPNKDISLPNNNQQNNMPNTTPSLTGANNASSGMESGSPKKNNYDNDQDRGGEQGEVKLEGFGTGNVLLKVAVVTFAPILAIVLLFVGLFNAISNVSEYEDALGASEMSGGSTGGLEDFEPSSQEAKEFYERVNNVKSDYQSKGKSVDVLKVVATYHVLSTTDGSISYEDMTEGKIKEIADAMFDGNSYSEETFKNNLTTKIFPSYFPYFSERDYKQLTEDVFDYIDRYYSFIGEEESTCASLGSCIYEIKGIYIPGKGNYSKNIQVKDLKVRLMQCGGSYGSGTWGQPLEGEEEVPFEDYIMGVSYQEIGPDAPDEAQKAQLVAARSYSLGRPTAMNNDLGKKLDQEANGQWILQLSSCVADQVYCSPDKGCSAMNDGEQLGTVRSGTNYSVKMKGPLSEDHKLRTLAASVQGEVLVNNQSNIYYSSYTQTEQNKFTELAKKGLNYKQILMQVYGKSGAVNIQKMSCNTGSTSCGDVGSVSSGSYASWKQYEGPWVDIEMGNSRKTISDIGCLVTSVSILMAKSGVETSITNLNPGTFVQFLNANGGFYSGGNYLWAGATKAAPNFKFQNIIDISRTTKEQKLNTIKQLLNEGAYVVAEVKGNTGQHWVAIDAVKENTVIMMDPGSTSTDMWAQYDWTNTSKLAYYKIS